MSVSFCARCEIQFVRRTPRQRVCGDCGADIATTGHTFGWHMVYESDRKLFCQSNIVEEVEEECTRLSLSPLCIP